MDLADVNAAAPPDTALFERITKADTSCNPPIAFVPVWYTNYAETFIGTVVPLVELEDRKVLNYSTTTVIADVLHKHLPRGVCRSGITRRCTMTSWFRGFVSLAAQRLRFMHELEQPTCFSHFRFCQLRSMFDNQPKGVDAWASAQRLVERVLGDAAAPSPDTSGELRVLIERRYGGLGLRGRSSKVLRNVGALLDACKRESVLKLRCRPYSFGNASLEEDMRAVRWADVLVGMHGAGLTNAYFMRQRSALVEVRPFGFEGRWPDAYYQNILRLAAVPRIFHLTLSIGTPELCHPNVGLAVTPQTASYAASCALPWAGLRKALTRVAWWRGGEKPEDRYLGSAFYGKNVVAYDEEKEASGRPDFL